MNEQAMLIRTVESMTFEVTNHQIGSVLYKVLQFTTGLTLTFRSNPLLPVTGGTARLQVYKKLIPRYQKYLIWIEFKIHRTGRTISAQWILANRVRRACSLMREGLPTCFNRNPFLIRRSTKSPRRIRTTNQRS